METVALDIEGLHLRVGNLDALRVAACIEFALHRQASPGCGRTDQFDHRLASCQGLTPPVLGYVAEATVFDLVPFRGPWRIMADLKRQASFVSQVLKFNLEQAYA